MLFLLVLARMAGLFREVEATAEELEFQGAAPAGDARPSSATTEADRRQLLDRVLSASDEERRRLAAELHDGPIQRLATLQYGLERARLQLERGRVPSPPRRCSRDARPRSCRSRRTPFGGSWPSFGPPALDESGLVGAVRDQVVGFERQTGVDADLQAEVGGTAGPGARNGAIPRHSGGADQRGEARACPARRGDAALRGEATVELEVADDGVGFDRGDASSMARNGHLGLVAMRERVEMAGGTWRVESVPNEGTRVQVRFEKAKV